MIRQSLIAAMLVAAAAAPIVAAAPSAPEETGIAAAVAAPTRSPANVARDAYRHPLETLRFFGVGPGDTVVEIWPGGGWYTEILAPLTHGSGKLYAAVLWPDQADGMRGFVARDPAAYGEVQLAAFPGVEGAPKVPDGSADVVLTFRNVHNWRMGYRRDGKDYSAQAFREMFAMLRKGGTLGVVDHRLPEDASDERERSSGYIKVSTVRRLAEAAGFRYVGASEVNANPNDSADWPQGVWTLPPTYTLKQVDRDKYAAIGESDRMTLKFKKP